MYANASSALFLTLENLGLSNTYIFPAFVFSTILYLFIMSCNLLILTTIAYSRRIHKPMYILLFNLPISDMVGATAFFPQFIMSIVTQNRQISYPLCVTQAFLIHFYGTGNLLILSAMAYDRYIAICCPLRYNAIMTPHNLMRIIIAIWFLSFLIMFILMMLLVRFKLCRTNLVDFFCNNPSLLKLVCADTSVNNFYGLFFIAVLQGAPLSLMMYTYGQILRTCLVTNGTDARRKAMQTCGTHLVVYLILQVNTLVTLVAHRIGSVSPALRRALGVSILVFPPVMDPIIYGLKTQELKESVSMLLRRKG